MLMLKASLASPAKGSRVGGDVKDASLRESEEAMWTRGTIGRTGKAQAPWQRTQEQSAPLAQACFLVNLEWEALIEIDQWSDMVQCKAGP